VEMGLKSWLFILGMNPFRTSLIPRLFLLVPARQNALTYLLVRAHYSPYEGLVYVPLCLYCISRAQPRAVAHYSPCFSCYTIAAIIEAEILTKNLGHFLKDF